MNETAEQKFKRLLMSTQNMELIDAYMDHEKKLADSMKKVNLMLEQTLEKLKNNKQFK